MTHFNSSGWVSIAEIIVFVPSAIAALLVCSRHGFTRSSGFIYTLILSIIRIVGAICQLITYHDQSSGLLKAVIIIDSIGLGPLLLATLGMLSRLVDQINSRAQAGFFTTKHFRGLQLLISLGVILSIAGGSSGSTDQNGNIQISTTTKVAIILFLVAFIGMMLILVVATSSIGLVSSRERLTALAVIIAAPFIVVRLAYSTLAVFLHNHDFSIVNGSVPIHVAMSVIEEFIVVIVYLVLGFMINKLDNDQRGPIASRPWKEEKDLKNSRDNLELGGQRYQPSSVNYETRGYATEQSYYTPQQAHMASNRSS